MKKTLMLISLAVLASACIVGESSHQLLITPGGQVTWVVYESELRSNADSRSERVEEEAVLLKNARYGLHPIARAFNLLDPETIDHLVLRDRRPYEIRTEATFRSAQDLVTDILDRLGLVGSVRMWSENEVTHLEVVVETSGDDAWPEHDDILALFDDISDYRFVMTEGRFVDAVGFEIIEDGAVAVPIEVDNESDTQADTPLVLSLSWSR